MFGKKKEEKRPANARRSNLAQFGLIDIPYDFGNPDAMGGDDDDDDDDLEAELLALTSGSASSRAKRGKPKPATANLDAMVAASMKDLPSDDDSSVDENDPELLAELGDLVPEDEAPPPPPPAPRASVAASASSSSQVALLEQRLAMYREAENNAKQVGDSARARRFSRGLKTLTDQLKQARAGRVVPEEEIPPAVATNVTKKPDAMPGSQPDVMPGSQPEPSSSDLPASEQPKAASSPQVPGRPSRTAPPPPASAPASFPSVSEPAEDDSQLAELLRRQLCFKQAALAAKKTGDTDNALKYMRVCKQFDSVIAAVKSGSPVDLSEMPDPPQAPQTSVASPPAPQVREAEVQGEGEGPQDPTPKGPSLPPELLSPPNPTSVADALQQRYVRYQAEEKLAKDAGNTSKSRRMGRIAKQYQDAIKLHKAGKPIPVDELPTPPGYAAIPVPGAPPPAAAEAAPSAAGDAPAVAPPTPPKVAKPSPNVLQRQTSEVRKSPQSRQEKQKLLLQTRQKEFKEAALAAKCRGEIDQARELLRQAKGFDALIEASNNGLPVDLATLPVPPGVSASLDTEFEYVNADDCEPGGSGEIYEKLEEDLTKQIKLCLATRDHFRATGDVAGANRFEQLAVQSKRDLNMVKACKQRGETLPRFKYETRSFSILQCCTDLADNDLELNIVQGISYNVPNPKEVDTYVKYEFPFPQETPPKDKTALIRDTNNPQYNQSFLLPIARTSRACQRVFKRHGVKLEVWSKGGFLRSDTLLGTAVVKLQPLETKCILHESFPLMDGRKAVGGQLEVKIRIRHPIVTRQVEQRQERWLVLAETT